MNKLILAMLFLCLSTAFGQGSQVTFVAKTKVNTYIFHYKGNIITASCNFKPEPSGVPYAFLPALDSRSREVTQKASHGRYLWKACSWCKKGVRLG